MVWFAIAYAVYFLAGEIACHRELAQLRAENARLAGELRVAREQIESTSSSWGEGSMVADTDQCSIDHGGFTICPVTGQR